MLPTPINPHIEGAGIINILDANYCLEGKYHDTDQYSGHCTLDCPCHSDPVNLTYDDGACFFPNYGEQPEEFTCICNERDLCKLAGACEF